MPLPKLSARVARQSDRSSGRGAMAYRHAVPNMKAAPLDSMIIVGSEYLFEAKSLKKEFDDGQVQALRGVDFHIGQGEFVAVIGPSGCGKSTLLQMLGALDRPSSGTLQYRGNSIAD